MLRRTQQPNAHLWNGLGGKIEAGETPLACIYREMLEEADVNLREASSLFFAGITTWGLANRGPENGMYVFIATLSPSQAQRIRLLNTPEGQVTWKPLAWVCDPDNQEVVSNIPHFLPPMLNAQAPYDYFYGYEREDDPAHSFCQLILRPLPSDIILTDCQP